MSENTFIGKVVGGGLKESLQVRLEVPADQVVEGAFVVIEHKDWLFHGLVTDLQLGSTDPRFADEPIDTRISKYLAEQLYGQTLYTNAQVLPALMMERGPDLNSPEYAQWRKAVDAGLKEEPTPRPVKTIPPHHAQVRLAQPGDIAEIFGKAEEKSNFVIGYTREQGHPVVINMEKFVQRSSGVFGATGTGKSFLTRMVLAGLIHYDKASVLVFDMHNEYGLNDVASDTGKLVIGLRPKFGAKVQVAGLGAGTLIRGQTPDFHLEIPTTEIRPQDIEMLTRELNLKETTPTTLDALVGSFQEEWFSKFRDMTREMTENEEGKRVPANGSIAYWADSVGINRMAAEGLHSKMRRVFNSPYIKDNPAADGINTIVDYLQNGRHVVLSFGKFESDLDYLLVSNILTRKIRQVWEETTNEYRSSGKGEPRPLVIVVEEAHKLLNREMAAQTTFSTIARELRKYYVTLLIIDQRPSQIYDEVMSQLGTRVSGWLGDDDDIRAVLSGLAGRDALRGMLARLQPKEEVMMMGWGVPMPLPVRSRRYDEKFWDDLLGDKNPSDRSEDEILKELGF